MGDDSLFPPTSFATVYPPSPQVPSSPAVAQSKHQSIDALIQSTLAEAGSDLAYAASAGGPVAPPHTGRPAAEGAAGAEHMSPSLAAALQMIQGPDAVTANTESTGTSQQATATAAMGSPDEIGSSTLSNPLDTSGLSSPESSLRLVSLPSPAQPHADLEQPGQPMGAHVDILQLCGAKPAKAERDNIQRYPQAVPPDAPAPSKQASPNTHSGRSLQAADGTAVKWSKRGAVSPPAPAPIPPTVPELPGVMTEWPDVLAQMREFLLGAEGSAGTVVLSSEKKTEGSAHGQGGAGKTTMAAAFVRDSAVRKGFERIGWVSVGRNPGVMELQRVLFHQLTTETILSKDGANATTQLQDLRDACVGKRWLVVLDDVWATEHEQMLNCVDTASASKLLVTTRIRYSLRSHIGVHRSSH